MQAISQIKVCKYDLNFALMKIKVGQVVKNQVAKSGIPKSRLAQKIGISRNWLNVLLDDEMMESEYIVKIGKSIQYDFSKDFHELNSALFSISQYNSENLDDCQRKLLEVTEKYVALLEKYTLLVETRNTI